MRRAGVQLLLRAGRRLVLLPVRVPWEPMWALEALPEAASLLEREQVLERERLPGQLQERLLAPLPAQLRALEAALELVHARLPTLRNQPPKRSHIYCIGS